MKISVVVPSYNEEKYLPLCLTALTSQNYPKEDFEIIVVDNNSTDRTAQIAQQFGAKVIKEAQQGYVYSLRRGMDEAEGEVIAVTDADSRPDPNWLAVICQSFQSDDDLVGLTGSAPQENLPKLLGLALECSYELFLRLVFALGKPNLTGFNLAVRKSALEKVGGLDVRYTMGPDVDLGLRLKKIGEVKFVRAMRVYNSPRRWQDNFFKAFWEYAQGNFYVMWRRRPLPFRQKPIR